MSFGATARSNEKNGAIGLTFAHEESGQCIVDFRVAGWDTDRRSMTPKELDRAPECARLAGPSLCAEGEIEFSVG